MARNEIRVDDFLCEGTRPSLTINIHAHQSALFTYEAATFSAMITDHFIDCTVERESKYEERIISERSPPSHKFPLKASSLERRVNVSRFFFTASRLRDCSDTLRTDADLRVHGTRVPTLCRWKDGGKTSRADARRNATYSQRRDLNRVSCWLSRSLIAVTVLIFDWPRIFCTRDRFRRFFFRGNVKFSFISFYFFH